MKKTIFITLMIMIPVIVLLGGFLLVMPMVKKRMEPLIMKHIMDNMSEQDHAKIYMMLAQNFGNLWDTVPEADVGRIMKRSYKGTVNRAKVNSNNAGMRSSRPYVEKPKDVFRIVCMGDSYTFGSGCREEDRFSDLLEGFYRDRGIEIEGKKIESYCAALGSWTLVQEATYLSSRISEYDPDIIILLTCHNDITNGYGVTGSGVITNNFSAEDRAWGNGFYNNQVNTAFRAKLPAALQWDLSPASHAQWDRGMTALSRLVELQHRRSKKILLATLIADGSRAGNNYAYSFRELFNHHLYDAGIEAPVTAVTYFSEDKDTRLPHDAHPSRKGHTYLCAQFIHALHRLGWIRVPEEKLPLLDNRFELTINPPVNRKAIEWFNEHWVDSFVHESLDFSKLTADHANAFLCGIFPEKRNTPFDGFPWASIRAGFLLKIPDDRLVKNVEVRIKTRPLVELFPLVIDIQINGKAMETFKFDEPSKDGYYVLSADLPPISETERVAEVVLTSRHYFTEFEDDRMKSYQLVSARIR